MKTSSAPFRRKVFKILFNLLQELRRFLQVFADLRQAGKITLARQTIEQLRIPTHYASADEPTLKDRAWIEQQWNIDRL